MILRGSAEELAHLISLEIYAIGEDFGSRDCPLPYDRRGIPGADREFVPFSESSSVRYNDLEDDMAENLGRVNYRIRFSHENGPCIMVRSSTEEEGMVIAKLEFSGDRETVDYLSEGFRGSEPKTKEAA